MLAANTERAVNCPKEGSKKINVVIYEAYFRRKANNSSSLFLEPLRQEKMSEKANSNVKTGKRETLKYTKEEKVSNIKKYLEKYKLGTENHSSFNLAIALDILQSNKREDESQNSNRLNCFYKRRRQKV